MPGASLLSQIAVAAVSLLPGAATEPAPQARLAFTSGDRIHLLAADGSGRTPLTADGAVAGSPAWSPDGRRLAYSVLVDEDLRTQIRAVDADGGGDAGITRPTRPGVFEGEPSWSPDGRQVVISRLKLGRSRLVSSLVVVNADGSGERTLLRESARTLRFVHAPAWSPRGDRILFTRTRLDRRARFRPTLHSMPSASGAATVVARDAHSGAWSPDGARIAYASLADRNGETCGSDECSHNGEIYASDPDGANPRRLTNDPGDEANPSWSPDGRWIAFDSNRNYPTAEQDEVYVVSEDGSCMTWLTNGSASSGDPAWQPAQGAVADPGACGATERPPLAEVDLAAARRVRGVPVYWLGETFGSLLLSDAEADRSGASFSYGDCASYDPADCPPPLDISTSPACSRLTDLTLLEFSERLTRVRGALVSVDGPESGVRVFTGRSSVAIFGGTSLDERPAQPLTREERRVIGALRTVDQAAPSARDLPRAALPGRLLRTLRRTEILHRRLGSVRAVHRRLGISRSAVKQRLRVARRVRALGGARTLRC